VTEGPKQADPATQPTPETSTSKVAIGCIGVLIFLVILAVLVPIIFGASS
jgi:hypothetical protein